MAYRTDGSPHTGGKQNETDMAQLLRDPARLKRLFPSRTFSHYKVEEHGAPHEVEDVVIIEERKEPLKISVKRKKGTKNGSFDYINSSKIAKEMEVFSPAQNVHDALYGFGKDYKDVEFQMKNACHNNLKLLGPEGLQQILHELCSHYDDIETLITDSVNRTIYSYSFVDTPLHNSIMHHTPFIEVSDGSTSATIKFRDQDSNIVNHGLRIRLGVNNGYTVLSTGRTKKGKKKASAITVKLQQDDVHGMLAGITKKNIINY